MARGCIEVFAPGPDTVAVALEVHGTESLEFSHVVGVDHRYAVGAPFAGIQDSVAVGDALRLVGLFHADMHRVGRIADVHALHAVLAGAEKQHVAAHLDAGGKFHRIETLKNLDIIGVVHIEHPGAGFAAGGIEVAVLHGQLPHEAVNIRTGKGLGVQGVRHIHAVDGLAGTAVKDVALYAHRVGASLLKPLNGRDALHEFA